MFGVFERELLGRFFEIFFNHSESIFNDATIFYINKLESVGHLDIDMEIVDGDIDFLIFGGDFLKGDGA